MLCIFNIATLQPFDFHFFSAVDDANKYEVAFIEDGISTGTRLPTEPTIKKTSMKGEIQYELRIKAIREIDINNNGNPVQFFGDVLKINLPGRKLTFRSLEL